KSKSLLLLSTYSFVLELFTAIRQQKVPGIPAKFPNKIPVRLHFLSLMDKTKLLPYPGSLLFTLPSITTLLSCMVLRATEAFYLLVNNKSLDSMNVTMAEIYRDYKDEDGFVFMTYASQETFGSLGSADLSHKEDRKKNPKYVFWSYNVLKEA
uniref:Autophagy-related protein n=1 Tax=Marmota marmota marmota TaxID=9994 RepID=A0A8C6AE00_MARMA